MNYTSGNIHYASYTMHYAFWRNYCAFYITRYSFFSMLYLRQLSKGIPIAAVLHQIKKLDRSGWNIHFGSEDVYHISMFDCWQVKIRFMIGSFSSFICLWFSVVLHGLLCLFLLCMDSYVSWSMSQTLASSSSSARVRYFSLWKSTTRCRAWDISIRKPLLDFELSDGKAR
jgi:hypothetical protein